MTTNSNGAPGNTRHLNDIAVCCENPGMRVICVDDAESDFWLSASLPCATVLEGKVADFSGRTCTAAGTRALPVPGNSGGRYEHNQTTDVPVFPGEV